jgi:hypothetical protein
MYALGVPTPYNLCWYAACPPIDIIMASRYVLWLLAMAVDSLGDPIVNITGSGNARSLAPTIPMID